MVLGYPGTTQRYVPSQAIDLIMSQSNPAKVSIRTAKLDIWERRMTTTPKIRIQYASKYVSASNSWKKWQGEVKGLKRLDVINLKKKGEAEFEKWIALDPKRKEQYGNILSDFERLYNEYKPYLATNDYYTECIQRGSDIFMLASKIESLEGITDKEKLAVELKKLREYVTSYFKDYDQPTDELVWNALLKIYVSNVDPKFMPEKLIELIPKIGSEKFLGKIYRKSMLTDSLKINQLINSFDLKAIKNLQKDPAYALFRLIKQHYQATIDPTYKSLYGAIGGIQHKYTAALLEMKKGERIIADANLTLRVCYGKVEGYKPADGGNL